MTEFTVTSYGWSCDTCGALVISTSLHAAWHEGTSREIAPAPAAEVAVPATPKRGGRLPSKEWRPADETIRSMMEKFPHITREEWTNTHEAFIDYWIGVPGQRGSKLDWDATWRNWMRREFSQAQYRARTKMMLPTPSTVDQKVADLQAMKEPE